MKVPTPTVDAIFFDFDGVILDSVELKEIVFRNIICRHAPEQVERIMQYYWKNGGISRLVKFRWIWQNILGRSLDDAGLETLDQEFSHSVYDLMLGCDFVPGAEQFLIVHHTR
ncbi:MAG: hypothetical protein IH933_05275, partial [Euryarchaeota archaeon]|nr:hypothetical protein [Euryarchaeota archaeon]